MDPNAAEPAPARPLRLAVMQPYLFPYLGYFRLAASVDRFVFYDDVAYIRGGWINRNRWLVDGRPTWFTVPLRDASSFRPIRETWIDRRGPWQRKLMVTLRQHYGRAPHFGTVAPMIESVLATPAESIGELARASVKACAGLMGLEVDFVDSSATYGNAARRGQDRVLDICRLEGAGVYVNLPSGRALYDPAAFAAQGVELRFVVPLHWSYPQGRAPFVPDLSVIDGLMHAGPRAMRAALEDGR